MDLPAISPLQFAENVFHNTAELITIHFCTPGSWDDHLDF